MKRALKIAATLVVVLVIVCVVFVFVRAAGADERFTFRDVAAPDVVASSDAAVIARGRALAHGAAHCSQCHGDYPRMQPQKNVGDIALSGGIDFAMGPMGTLYASNLTPTGIAARSDVQLARAIATGVLHDGRLSMFMRYSAANLSHDDLVAVVSYLRSLPPAGKAIARGELTTMGKAMFSFLPMTPDVGALPAHVAPLGDGEEPSVARGAYLAEHVALCVACHTTIDTTTFEPIGPKAGGGNVEPSHGDDSDKEFQAPNLTSHATGMTGKLSEDQFVARIKQGRVFASSLMPWENFTRMSDGDVRSIYRYLRMLPPIDNDVGPTYRDSH